MMGKYLVLCDDCGHCYSGEESDPSIYASLYIDAAETRIAELEAKLDKALTSNVELASIIAELEAKLERLTNAAARVAFECAADDWSCEPSIEGSKRLLSALQENDDECE